MTPGGRRPADAYEAFVLDLDGVVYRGDAAVPGAADTVAALRSAGKRVVFLTNNSARTPQDVAQKLVGLGIDADPRDVVTSAQAAAMLVARDGAGRSAYVVGEEGIRRALVEAGIEVVDGEPSEVSFVVVGWDRGVDYEKLRTATVLVRRGARLVATNADATYPAPGGELWPGAGSLLAAVETASGRRATVAGKPQAPLFEVAVERAGTGRALVVGDRLETDVLGAARAGLDAALVFSGAARPADLLDQDHQPIAAFRDITGLLGDHPRGRIRPAEDRDLDAVRTLVGTSAAPGAPADTVVMGDPEPIATAAAEVQGDQGYLSAVAVAEEARGRFLGSLVTAAAARLAARRGARRLFLVTDTAERLFERLGFRPVDREALPAWVSERSRECPRSAVAMVRPVA